MLWAFPVYLLAISLSIVLITHGIDIGPISINAGSLWLPIFIIGIVYVPYVARPIRGQVLALKQSEFVLAAIGLGVPAGSHPAARHPAECHDHADRLRAADDGAQHADRIGAVVPVDRRAAARCQLGHHHPGRPGVCSIPARWWRWRRACHRA